MVVLRAPPTLLAKALQGALLLLVLSAPACAEDALTLWLDGREVTLAEGLGRTADGKVWIPFSDVQDALDVAVKRLVPRPPEGKRPQARRERDAWVLCGAGRCRVYRGRTLGGESAPTFELGEVAKLLGYRLRQRADGVHLDSADRPARARATRTAGIGTRVRDLELPFLDGSRRRLSAHRGRRLLVITWAPWSTTREQLEAWRSLWSLRSDQDLDLWLVALDVEGEKRVREYVPAGFEVPVALDRNADVTRVLTLRGAGHWFLLDELGILRAEREGLTLADLQWIDLHLGEPRAAVEPVAAPARAAGPDLATLRAHVEARPRDVVARLALAAALEAAEPDEARDQVAEVVRLKPRSTAFAFRLARLFLDGGDTAGALRTLDEARRRQPSDELLRMQTWALEAPERFYGGAIDLKWQKQKRKEERAWLGRPRRR